MYSGLVRLNDWTTLDISEPVTPIIVDKKLEIIHINNTINLDDNDENFTELFEQELLINKLNETKYNIDEIYYSIL